MDKPPPYMRGLTKPEPLVRLTCPCCGTEQPAHSAIPYCDDCNDDSCGHHPEDETMDMMLWCVRHREYETEGCDGDT
jgi:hypothetical protein